MAIIAILVTVVINIMVAIAQRKLARHAAMTSNTELSQLAAFSDLWGKLEAVVLEELDASPSPGHLEGGDPTVGPWRRLLAIHTSNTCRVDHEGGVVFSLKPTTTTASDTGGVACELRLPNLFLECTPPRPWVVRAEAETMKQAEETCCKWTLLFCIGTGPDLVHLHPSTLRNAGRIRQLGRQLQAKALAVASSGAASGSASSSGAALTWASGAAAAPGGTGLITLG